MFAKRGRTKTQAKRDEEWRMLVRSITKPDGAPSEEDEARFRAYLDDLGARPRRRRLRWMGSAADDVDNLEVDREQR
jgi:hypothetical protein